MMQVEAGGYYRDANGDKQGPMRNGIVDVTDGYHWYTEGPDWAGWSDQGKSQEGTDAVDLVAEWSDSPPLIDGPVRTVTRREVVEGVYAYVAVCPHEPGTVLVGFAHPHDQHYHAMTASELKAAAAVLLELAGALDSD